MKIKSKSSILPKILIGLTAVVIITGGYLAYSSSTDIWPFNKNETSKEDNNRNSEGDNPISSTKDAEEDDPTANTPVEFTPPKDSESPKKDILTGIINYKGVVDNSLTIRTTINQLVNSGECNLKLSAESGKIIEETAKITAGPSTSTCDGFSIPASKLSTGKWNIEITLNSSGKQGVLRSTVAI